MINLPARTTEIEPRNFLQARISIHSGLAIVSIASAALGALAIIFLQLTVAGARKLINVLRTPGVLNRDSIPILFGEILQHERTHTHGLTIDTEKFTNRIGNWRAALISESRKYAQNRNEPDLVKALHLLVELNICDLKLRTPQKNFTSLAHVITSNTQPDFITERIVSFVTTLVNTPAEVPTVVNEITTLCAKQWELLPPFLPPRDRPEAATSNS